MHIEINKKHFVNSSSVYYICRMGPVSAANRRTCDRMALAAPERHMLSCCISVVPLSVAVNGTVFLWVSWYGSSYFPVKSLPPIFWIVEDLS